MMSPAVLVGAVNSVTIPFVVTRPTSGEPPNTPSVNQMFPSGPSAMNVGKPVVGKKVNWPAGVILPTHSPLAHPSDDVNHRSPSAPAAILLTPAPEPVNGILKDF